VTVASAQAGAPRPGVMWGGSGLRIAMFSESYLPRISGVVHSLTAFASSLRAEGHRVFIVAPRVRGYLDADPDVLRVPSVPTPYYDFPLGLGYTPAVWRTLMASQLDVVHAHAPFTMGSAGAHLARRRGLPLVFTHHTLYDEFVHYAPGPKWLLRLLTRWYVRRYADRCDCVIAPSATLVARLRAQGVRNRIEVLPTAGVELELFASLDPSWVRTEFGLPAGRPLLVTASRLGKEKTVDRVLHAFAQVLQRRDAVLLVVGGGPEEAALRRLSGELHLGPRIVFAGLQPHRRTLECIAAGDLFLYGSGSETQGLVIVEAMAAGVPVVAVNAGGVGDAVRDGLTGFLVPPSAAALAEKVIDLLDDAALRRTMAAHAKEVAAEFALPALTRRLVEIYRSLLPVRRR